MEIKETVIRILSDLHPDVDFETNEVLVDDGVLDSLDIVSLISEISAELDITIPPEEIIPENFNSASALAELLSRLDEE
ncbi:MAG: acyl carrier protein [Clostridia bacterium]|nr:acyl carrier protein [Clostridia bacterium]